MADNTAVFQYDGAVPYDNIATEDIGGKKHQKIRLNIGAPGAEAILAKGQQAKANSLPVVLASDQDPLNVVPQKPSTAGFYSTAFTTASTPLLALNVNRRGATIYNNCTTSLSVGLATNALTQPSVVIPPNGYYEVPFNFIGVINGAWAAGGAGTAWVTELL